MVSEDKQIWHCFGCQKGGDIFGFVMEMEGLDFRGALELLAEKSGVELKKTNPVQAAQKNKTLDILEMATKFYQAHLLQTASGKKILGYLKDRGINDESIKNFRLGYAPNGWTHALDFLIKNGFSEQEIAKTGLLVESQKSGGKRFYDRFRDRIMFPIADVNGKVVGYSARVAPGGDESQAKYVNTPETEVYHKSKILYGISRAKGEIRQQKSVLLVEGNMDVIAAHQAGIANTVAVSGTALTEEHLNIIKRYTDKIKMCFDMDSAGEAATKKSLRLCFEKEINAQVVQLPSGKDAADLVKNDPGALKIAVEGAQSAMEYLFASTFKKFDKEKVEDKKIITQELLEMIGYLANDVEKNHWLKKLATELEIEESVLTDMLKRARLKERVVGASEIPSQENRAFMPSGKIETLMKDLIGLALIYESAWKRIVEEKDLSYLPKDSLLSTMIEKGANFRFNFDELVRLIDSPEDRTKAEKIYFENRYRIGLNNSLEEVSIEKPVVEIENRLRKIKYEVNKENLEKISKDLDAAKKAGDQGAVRFLESEFVKINKEQFSLNKELN